MPSPTFVGRSAEDLNVTGSVAANVSGATGDTADTTSRASQATRDEIDDATQKLKQHFDRLASDLRGQIAQFTTTVRNSDWEGSAKNSALQLSETFNTRLESLVNRTTERIDGFKTWMTTSAETFNEDVTTTLGGLLGGLGEQYTGLSTTVNDFNAQMDALESAGSTRFAE